MPSRFDAPSTSLDPHLLLRRTQSALWLGLALAVAVHTGASRLRGQTQAATATRPLTTHFVKRQPRLTKPLELKKRPRPRQRQMQRRMVAVRAKVDRGRVRSSVRSVDVVQRLAKPSADVRRFTRPASDHFEPQAIAEAIAGAKDAKQAVALSLELLDIDALDTGKYHAMVVQDPTDKKNIQGFCHLAVLYVPRMHDWAMSHTASRGTSWFNFYVAGCVNHLAEALNRYTQIRTDVNKRLTMDAAELFKTPWVFFYSAQRAYDLSEYEMNILGRYMMAGGLLFGDSHPYQPWRTIQCHTQSVLGGLRAQGVITSPEILPNSHPLYHCYFDFDAPPGAADSACIRSNVAGIDIIDHLKGVIVDGRLVAILSEKGYYSPWSDWGTHPGAAYKSMDPTRQLQFGVNVIILALTQEGSITRRLMDSVEH